MAERAVLIAASARDPFASELVQLLREQGREVLVAHDAEAAQKAARTRRPALLVLDPILPGGDGLTLCRWLKSDPETAGIHVLCFSVLMAPDRCLEAGADGFMLKPVEQESLLARIGELLDDRVRQLPRRAK